MAILVGLGGCDGGLAESGRFEAVVWGSGVKHVLEGPATLARVPTAPALRLTLRDDEVLGRVLTIVLADPATGRVEIGPRAEMAYALTGGGLLVGETGTVQLDRATHERAQGSFEVAFVTPDGEATAFTAAGTFDARADA